MRVPFLEEEKRKSASVHVPMMDMDLTVRRGGRNKKKERSWLGRNALAVRYGLIAAIAMSVGAGFEYLFDPRMGRRRRKIARDKSRKMWNQGARRVNRTSRVAASKGRGLERRMMHSRDGHTGWVDDRTLEDRVQSMVFRHTDAPKGPVSIQVVEGVVELRGALENPRHARELEEAARRVPGVRGVRSFFHPVGTEAPNKAEAIEAADEFLEERALH